jgi:YidC/Oxa1 family membrane protein insertase
VSYMLFLEWNAFQEAQLAQQPVEETTLSSAPTESIPVPTESSDESSDLPVIQDEEEQPAPIQEQPTAQAKLIKVSTDTLEVLIDSQGGDIVKVSLPEHARSLGSEESFVLMDRTASHTYIARSGLVSSKALPGIDASTTDRPIFSSAKSEYIMHDNGVLEVDLKYSRDNVHITKRFSFEQGSNLILIEYLVDNQSDTLWKAAMYGQIRRDSQEVKSDVGIGMQPYLGAAITTLETNYKKVDFDDIEDKNCGIENSEDECKLQREGGWIALVQHYFVSAWVPASDEVNKYRLYKNQGINVLEYLGAEHSAAPGEETIISSSFYAGPKNIKTLEKISPFLDLTIDFSWLWFIAKPLFFGLDFIHGFVGNWGVAIILLTFCIKLLFFYPSAISYRSMAKMRKVQPKMMEIKERCGDDRQKMSTEMMKLYRTEKVSPFGGCLPILLQMPVFIALYWTLMESVELRHAPFMLWIQDLSMKDPFFILPLIMGATMFIQQKLNPTPPDPMQAKVMQMMPIFFTVLFLMFPAGLVLYWVVNNTLSIAQQYVITRQIERAG